MTVVDLQEAIKGLSPSVVQWSETNGWVSAKQLRFAPPLGHLYAYLLASNFLVPMENSRNPYRPGLINARGRFRTE
jgi:hypothetical protein